MAKTCTPHKHLIPKNKIATKVKGIIFEKRYFISCTLRVMNRHVKYSLFINFGSLWHLFRISIITSFFFFSFPAKKEISFEASIPSEGRYFWDLLTPVTFYRYFLRFATFEGSLLSELYPVQSSSVLHHTKKSKMADNSVNKAKFLLLPVFIRI